MALMIHEVLKQVSKARSKKKKIEALKDNDSETLRDLMKMNFDKTIRTLLPEGVPPHKSNEEGDTLVGNNQEFINFVRGGPGQRMQTHIREKRFIDLIEKLHPAEVEVLVAVKDKSLDVKGLDAQLVNEIWPGLLRLM